MVLESVLVHSFTSGWPEFPAPLVKEIVFNPLYILASFVKDKVPSIFLPLGIYPKTFELIGFHPSIHPLHLMVVTNPGGSAEKNLLWCRRCRRPGFDPWVRKIPWRRARKPTPGFLPGESHGQRSLAGYSPQGHKESDTTERLSMHAHMHTEVFDLWGELV